MLTVTTSVYPKNQKLVEYIVNAVRELFGCLNTKSGLPNFRKVLFLLNTNCEYKQVQCRTRGIIKHLGNESSKRQTTTTLTGLRQILVCEPQQIDLYTGSIPFCGIDNECLQKKGQGRCQYEVFIDSRLARGKSNLLSGGRRIGHGKEYPY